MNDSSFVRCDWRQRLAFVALWLIASCGLVWGPGAISEATPPETPTEQDVIKDQPGKDRSSSPVGPPPTVEGFRKARFGMSEEQVRQALRKDFPALAAKPTSTVHPSEKTTVLSLTVVDLLPHTGSAHISYIFGYHSKRLIQVNIVWSSDGSASGDETVVGTANSLRDYFTSENFESGNVVVNRQLSHNTILVFRASDERKRTILLVLSGAAASAWSEDKKGPRPPPLTLELSYIEDAAHPDVFRIGQGQF
jgi:hypothetical protein